RRSVPLPADAVVAGGHAELDEVDAVVAGQPQVGGVLEGGVAVGPPRPVAAGGQRGGVEPDLDEELVLGGAEPAPLLGDGRAGLVEAEAVLQQVGLAAAEGAVEQQLGGDEAARLVHPDAPEPAAARGPGGRQDAVRVVVHGDPAVHAALLRLEHRPGPDLAQLAAPPADVLVVQAEAGEAPPAAVADLVEQVADAGLWAQILDGQPGAGRAVGGRAQQGEQGVPRQFEDDLEAADGAHGVGPLGPGAAALPVAQRGQADGDALLLQPASQRVEAEAAGLDGRLEGDVEGTVLQDLKKIVFGDTLHRGPPDRLRPAPA